jgi:hypothetical protein
MAQRAVSEDPAEAETAIQSLRARGAAGLEALFQAHAREIQQHQSPTPVFGASPEPSSRWERLSRALDKVGGQRDCTASHLFWETNFERAKMVARSTGKPILSLRLLGHLDEELSCANSRFFRTALYANREISQFLKDHFVLHWQSVRPVPRITIDFGDGRRLERTITGNSIHYVLDADGRPIDALPGLYGPGAFLRALMQAENAAKQFSAQPAPQREILLRDYHEGRLRAIDAQWNQELAHVGITTRPAAEDGSLPAVNQRPSAKAATRITAGKRAVEMPVLNSLHAAPDPRALQARMDDVTWTKLARLHPEDSRLDESSRGLMRRKNPEALAAGKLTMSKMQVENPLLRAVRQFEDSLAEDTVRNEYLFHTKIHEWFAAQDATTRQIDALNEKVYGELFMTPSSDPWLGLKADGAYSALDHDGVVTGQRR